MTSANPSSVTEFELIAGFFTRATRHTVLGIGDDAALLKVRDGFELVAATVMMVEGTHFFPATGAEALGHKALAVNLSDMAAMGAQPRWAMLALALPEADPDWLDKFARGFFALASRYDVDLIGGDTTRGPRNLCIQIMGEVETGSALRRDGARIGDDVWVSGVLGEAALAVAHLKGETRLPEPVLSRCMLRLDWPQPRVELGRALLGVAHGAIDVSDGLLADLGHICERSGVGATLEFAALPCAAQMPPESDPGLVMRCLIAGGDDYELCFTAPREHRRKLASLSQRLDLALTRIGSTVPGSGVALRDANGRPMHWKEKGFEHFR